MNKYQKFDRTVLNPKHKALSFFNRNFFFLTTMLVVGLLCLCFFMFNQNIANLLQKNSLWNILLLPLQNDSVANLIANILAFVVVSLLLERHFGTLKYFVLIVLSIPLSSVAVFAFSQSWIGAGFSSVNYFLYALMLWALIFNFKGYFCGKARWIFPVLILSVVCLFACWDGDYSKWPQVAVKFGCFTDLCENVSHWASMVMGAGVGLFAQIYALGKKVKAVKKENAEPEKLKKRKKHQREKQIKSEKVVVMGSGKSAIKSMTRKN